MSQNELIEAVRPVIVFFEKLKVDYYVGGSVASSSVGVPRSTLDIDLVTSLDKDIVDDFVACLGTDYYYDKDAILSAIKNRKSFNLIHIPSAFKIDIFILKNRAYDQQTVTRRQLLKVGEGDGTLEMYFASPEDIILNKLEWFKLGGEVSDKQWSDILGILKVQKGNLNREYLSKWTKLLGINELYSKAEKEL